MEKNKFKMLTRVINVEALNGRTRVRWNKSCAHIEQIATDRLSVIMFTCYLVGQNECWTVAVDKLLVPLQVLS